MSDLFIKCCEALGMPTPKKEYRFHPPRRWRIDYAWPEHKLAVEIEGGGWIGGRHNRPVGFVKDMEKYNALTMDGYRLLRFTPQMVSTGYAYDILGAFFKYLEETKVSK